MSSTKYVGVKFNTGEHDVVPEIWLKRGKKKITCTYPDSDIMDHSKNMTPPLANWKKYNVSILAESSEYLIFFQTLKLVCWSSFLLVY